MKGTGTIIRGCGRERTIAGGGERFKACRGNGGGQRGGKIEITKLIMLITHRGEGKGTVSKTGITRAIATLEDKLPMKHERFPKLN